MTTQATTPLRGRVGERAVLDRLVSDARAGRSRVLVMRGEPGIGKTALLDDLCERSEGVLLVRGTGVESEVELPFAGLHHMCSQMMEDALEQLPRPQHEALRVAFGQSAGPAPDVFLLGLAVLNRLAAAAEEQPLLVVVDDAQWLDRASAQTLSFVARRLAVESVAIVFAVRDSVEQLSDLPELVVSGLAAGDARELLASVLTVPVDERVRERFMTEARGNPLALLELPHGLSVDELAGGVGAGDAHGVSRRIEESFQRRVDELPGDARLLLLVAAAEPLGDPMLTWRAAARLAIAPGAAETAVASGLVSFGAIVAFRHPLVRSAIYRMASLDERRRVHRALAEATEAETDPDRRAWHLAAAAVGPDEQVALELELSASRVEARGGLAAAAAFLQRAVELTPDLKRRAVRALAAAEASFQAGAFDVALGHLSTAEAGRLDEYQRAQVDLARGRIAFASEVGEDAPRLLLKAARQLETLDVRLARETYLSAWGAAWVSTGQIGGSDDLVEVCRIVRALPPPRHPQPLDLLLDGLALLVTDGHAAATAVLQRAGKVLTSIPPEDVLRWGWMATAAYTAVWDFEGLHAITAKQVQLMRDAGALAQLPLGLSQLGMARAWMGDFAGAVSCAAEFDSVAAATGSPIAPYILLRLRALQGREPEAAAAIANALELATARPQAIAAVYAHWAAAILYNGLARYEEALSAACEATSDILNPWMSIWALAELVEAAARGGDTELAGAAVERLAETTEPSGTDFALGIQARCRALLSVGASAEDLYREAIDRLSRTRLRPDLARAHLLYGEWQRRENRRVDARAELRVAYDQFTSIGMEAFAERARRELLATGEKARKRTVETRDDLTAQERQIAELARDGLSNPEIGARLFLSPRTVEWHLRKVFGKLGIHYRQELDKALASSESELVTT
ncbi:MAG TPA: AAA family ATPase [Solirubrobacteraceae bacterium]|jgi:DNA-binding CsgD family transcriptional regulator